LALDPSRSIAFHRLVDIAKLRWRIERDYQELKQGTSPSSNTRLGGR
jgi:SRSO17 transposase